MKIIRTALIALIITAFVLFLIFPVVFTLAFSFIELEGGNIFSVKLVEMPSITLNEYRYVLSSSQNFYSGIKNSLFYTGTITVLSLLIAAPAAFALAKFSFPGRNALFFLMILIMMMPFQVTMVPNFIALNKLNILNTPAAVILPGIFSAFGIFLLRQFILHIPDDTIEAAQIDGAGTFQIFLHIVLPMSKNSLAAFVIFVFADNWSMIEQPLMYLSQKEHFPLSLMLRGALEISPNKIFVPSILFLLPIFLLYLMFKDKLINGISRLHDIR